MTKVNFLKQAESFMSGSYVSQLHRNVHKKTRKRRYLKEMKSNEKKSSGKDLNEIEARFAEGKQKMNSLKIKLQKYQNVNVKI